MRRVHLCTLLTARLCVIQVGLVALIESMHFWHVALLVYEIWTSHHPDFETIWGAASMALLILPTVLTLPIILVSASGESIARPLATLQQHA